MMKPCAWPGCPAIVPGRTRYCVEHQRHAWREQNAKRPPYRQRYPKGWEALRAQVLREEPKCRICGAPAVYVHHVKAKRDGGTDDRTNLRAVCRSCHSKIEATERPRIGAQWAPRRW